MNELQTAIILGSIIYLVFKFLPSAAEEDAYRKREELKDAWRR